MQRSLRFLVDAQLPPRLARALTESGCPSAHITDRLKATATDTEIASLANALGAAVLSKDEDFLDLLHRGKLETALVWIRIGNADIGRLWSALLPILPQILSRLDGGERLIEVPFPD